MVRLTYKKTEDNGLVSKPLLAGVNLLVVSINTEKLMVFFSSVYDGYVFHFQGPMGSVEECKAYAKTYCRSIGVNFSDEVRRGRNESET